MFRRATVFLYAVRIALRVRGYKKTQEWLQEKLKRHAKAATQNKANSESAEMICRMVSAAERYTPGRSTCLEESLVLWFLLRERDIRATLRIGVRKDDEQFEAHAWVEREGIALNQHEEQHRHYAPFADDLIQPPREQP
jgi:hypothetical protein